MRLETKRLRVRDLCAADAGGLFSILSDPAVMRFLEPPFTKERTRDFIETAGLCTPPLVYAVERRENGALVGHVIFHPFDEGGYELGWVLARESWGKGFASELTAALLGEARARGAAEAVLECDAAQAATRHIAEKSGFAPAGQDADGLLIYRKKL